MAQFEGYERREAKILAALKEYGISSIDECKEICDAKGIDPYKIVEETQPICFENAKWAYVVGAAIADLLTLVDGINSVFLQRRENLRLASLITFKLCHFYLPPSITAYGDRCTLRRQQICRKCP